jgi:hypothetical protein
MTAYLTDGTKSIPLASLRADAWSPADPLDGSGDLTAKKAFDVVPVLHRCVDIRAKAVQTMPYRLEKNGKDVSADPTYDRLRAALRPMLYLAEAGLCIKAAYWEKATNRMGRNPEAKWLAPTTITPEIDPARGLTGFRRTGGISGTLPVARVLYIWNLDPFVELGEGRSPVATVLAAAGVLHYLDLYAASFFSRGGIKMTLISVPPSTPPAERDKLKAWWDALSSGVRAAFRSVVISAEVKPTVIGSDPKDTAAPELVRLSREDICGGMGVPQSLVFSNPLAGGTVAAERLNFYDFTVIPECEHIGTELTEQWLDPTFGLRYIPDPDKLEAMQQGELAKAQGLVQVVGAGILLEDEARQMLGRDPKRIAEQKLQIAEAEQRKAEGLPEPPPEAPDEGMAPEVDPATLPPAEVKATDLRALDLDRWQTKALKALRAGKRAAVAFTPDALSLEDAETVRAALASAQDARSVKAAFDAIKAEPGADLTDAERRLYDKIRKVLARYEPEVVQSIVSGGVVDLSGLEAGLRAVLIAELTTAALSALGDVADAVGPSFDPAQMATAAGEWARGYSYELVRGLTDTTRASVAQAVAAFSEGGLSSAQVAQMLSPVFGARRSETIAQTEITRANSAAFQTYQQELAKYGLNYDLVWQTTNDGERVCPVCGPRNGMRQGDGWDEVPPAHPRCKCSVSLAPRRRR